MRKKLKEITKPEEIATFNKVEVLKDNTIPAVASTPLSEDERLEYAEIGHFHRHDNTIAYQLASVLLPLSFGSLALSAQFPNMRYALAVFSIVLYLYWTLVSDRLAWMTAVRHTRAIELETKAGLGNHRVFDALPKHLARKRGRYLSIRKLRWFFLFLLIICWAGRLLMVESIPPK